MANEKGEEFIVELKVLLEKYKIEIVDSDDYSEDSEGNEFFSGTNYTFKGDGFYLGMSELQSAVERK